MEAYATLRSNNGKNGEMHHFRRNDLWAKNALRTRGPVSWARCHRLAGDRARARSPRRLPRRPHLRGDGHHQPGDRSIAQQPSEVIEPDEGVGGGSRPCGNASSPRGRWGRGALREARLLKSPVLTFVQRDARAELAGERPRGIECDGVDGSDGSLLGSCAWVRSINSLAHVFWLVPWRREARVRPVATPARSHNPGPAPSAG